MTIPVKILLSLMILISTPALVFADVRDDFDKATIAMSNNNYSRANYFYFSILDREPNNSAALFGLAKSFYWQGNFQESFRRLNELLKNDASHHEALLLIASLYQQKNEWSKALKYASTATEHYPDNPDAWLSVSQAYTGMEDLEAAKKAMNQYRKLSSL